MPFRVEALARRVDDFDPVARERLVKLLERRLDALAQGFGGGLGREAELEAVADRREVGREAFERIFMRVLDVA